MDLITLLSNTANGLSAMQAKAATTSNNPGDIEKFIADLSSAIIKELVQQKLITRP